MVPIVVYHKDHLSTTSKIADIKGRAKFVAEKMRSVEFAAFYHFLADMFAIIAKLSLKMKRKDLILPVAVSSIRETVANVESLKTFNVANGHLKRFPNMVEESKVADEVESRWNTAAGGCPHQQLPVVKRRSYRIVSDWSDRKVW